jgi:hypothetical protein
MDLTSKKWRGAMDYTFWSSVRYDVPNHQCLFEKKVKRTNEKI